jgi:DNA-directed RNA polymerase specialized sigma24 family protein
LPTVPVDELTPERRLTSQDELLLLTRAFDRLPELTRTVIWMLRVEGYSQREAAQRLGIEEGALEGRMTRGLRQLARDMSSAHGDSAFPNRRLSGTDAAIGSIPRARGRRRPR